MISGRQLRTLAALAFSTLFILGCSVNDQLQGYLGSVNQKPALTVTAALVTEGSNLNLNFTISKTLEAEVVVPYTMSDNTATDGSDYTAITGDVTFGVGQTVVSVVVSTTTDTVYEGTESFNVDVTLPAELSGALNHPISILDDDSAPVISFAAASSNVMENSGAAHDMVVTITGSYERPQVISYMPLSGMAGVSDYTFSAGTITFLSGDTSHTLSVSLVNDALPEAGEDFSILMTGATGGAQLIAPTSHVVTIIDDDGVSLPIYRSVGPGNTSALATGAGNNLTIAASVATFTVALPNQVGVGDVIQYDKDNNGSIDSVVFIHQRISGTQYLVRTVAGFVVPDLLVADNDWSIYRAYTGIANAESGIENTGLDDTIENFDTWTGGKDLVAADQVWNVALYADAVETVNTKIIIDGPLTSGWTTSPTNYLRFFTPKNTNEVGVSQRHAGIYVATPTHYMLKNDATSVFGITANYVRFEGLQIDHRHPIQANSCTFCVGDGASFSGAADIQINANIVLFDPPVCCSPLGENQNVINDVGSDANVTIKAWNNVIAAEEYAYNNTNIKRFTAAKWYFYNNSMDNFSSAAVRNNGPDTNFLIKNNVLLNGWSNDRCFKGTSAFHPDSRNNVCGWDVDVNTPPNNMQACSVEISSGYDFRPDPNDRCLISMGLNLSADPYLAFSDDIVGVVRTGPWDIGAFKANHIRNYRSVEVGASGPIASSGGTIYANFRGATVDFNTSTAVGNGSEPTNLGMGDLLYFDSDNDTVKDAVVIMGGASESGAESNNYFYNPNGGGIYISTQHWEIYRAYTSLAHAESGNKNSGIPIAIRDFDNYTNGKDLVSAKESYYFNLMGTAADTTPVVWDGWVTNYDNRIYIQGPALSSTSAHKGLWSNTVYRLQTTSATALTLLDDNITIKDTQIEVINPATNAGCILIANNTSGSRVAIDNMLLKQSGSYGGNNYAVKFDTTNSSGTQYQLIRNIAYDIDPSGPNASHCFNFQTGQGSAYLNSLVGCGGSGFRVSGGANLRALNNLVQRADANDYDATGGVFNVASNGNLSEDASSTGGANDVTLFNVQFVNEAGADFTPSKFTSVKNLGVDLTPETPWGYFSSWHLKLDIKYQQPLTAYEPGAILSEFTDVFRSVAVGASAPLASGVGNAMTISGNTITFTSAVPDNVGVGDAVQYDSDSDGSIDAIGFIHSRNSSTSFGFYSKFGTKPMPVTGDEDWAIYRAYEGLAKLSDSNLDENDALDDAIENFDTLSFNSYLRANLNAALYGGSGPDVLTTNLYTSLMRPGYYRYFAPSLSSEVGISQKHKGKWDSSLYHVQRNNPSGIAIAFENYWNNVDIYVDGLQLEIQNSTTTAYRAIEFGTFKSATIKNSIVRKTGTYGAAFQIGIGTRAIKSYVYNNLVYGFPPVTAAFWNSMSLWAYGGTAYMYNNTVYGGYFGMASEHPGTVIVAKNNIIQNTSNSSVVVVNSGSYSGAVNNVSDDATGPGGVGLIQNATVAFVDAAGGDFRLRPNDMVAKGSGANLSADLNLAFTEDIAGVTRAGNWDRGAFELIETSQSILSLAKLTMVAQGENSFAAIMDYSGDINMDGLATLYYCNHTDSPGCDPLSGSSVAMSRYTTYFYGSVTGLSAPNNVGDTLNVKVVGVDPDGVVGSPAASTVLLNPILNISNVTVNEGQNANFVVSLTSPTSQAVTFNWATGDGSATTAGADYTTGSGVATIAVGKTSVTLPAIATADDGSGDPSEYFTVTLSALMNASPGAIVGTAVLKEVSTIKVDFAQAAQASAENTAGIPVVVNLSGVSGANVVVSFSYQGTATTAADYTVVTATPLTIPAGQTSRTILVNGVTDAVLESDETITFTMTAVTGGELGSQLVHTVYLKDDPLRLFNLVVTDARSDSFSVSVNYNGDANNNASVTLWYCNRTLAPICNPQTDGISMALIKDSLVGQFTGGATGLSALNGYGDTLAIDVVATDANGVTTEPLTATLQLSAPELNSLVAQDNMSAYSEGSGDEPNGFMLTYRRSTFYSPDMSTYYLSYLDELIYPLAADLRGYYGSVRENSNGSKVIFYAGSKIFVANRDGTGLVPVCFYKCSDNVYWFTPDDQKVIFKGHGDYTLIAAHIDGTNPVVINSDLPSGPSFSGSLIITSDSQNVIYEATTTCKSIWISKIDGSGSTRLSQACSVGIGTWGYILSPNETKIVYKGDYAALNKYEAWSVNLDGTGHANISGALVSGGVVNNLIAFLPDSTRVLFSADALVDNKVEVFSVMLDGTNRIVISGSTPAGDGATSFNFNTSLSADGSILLVKGRFDSATDYNLFAAKTDGTGFMKVNGPVATLGSLQLYKINSAGTYAYYTSAESIAGVNELYRTRLSDGFREKIGPNLTTGQQVYTFVMNADESKIMFSANDIVTTKRTGYVINADGSNKVTLTQNNEDAYPVAFTGANRVLYWTKPEVGTYFSDIIEHYVFADADTGGNKKRVSVPGFNINGSIKGFEAKGDFVYYINELGNHLIPPDCQLYRYDLKTKLATRLSSAASVGCVRQFVIGASRIFYRADEDTLNRIELYAVDLDGSNRIKIGAQPQSFSNVVQFSISPDGNWAAYVSDRDVDNQFELYVVDSAGTNHNKVSGAMVAGGDIYYTDISYDDDANKGNHRWIIFTDDNQKIIFLADRAVDGRAEVWSVNRDGTGLTQVNANIASGSGVGDFAKLQGQNRIVYRKFEASFMDSTLFSALIDGSSRIQLHATASTNSFDELRRSVSPNGQYVAFILKDSTGSYSHLKVVDVVTAAIVRLDTTVGDERVSRFAFTPDSSKVVYLSSEGGSLGLPRLYSININGTGRTEISGITAGTSEVRSQAFEISSDSQDVYFLANKDDLQKTELYKVKIDGTGMIKLNHNLVTNEDVTWIKLFPDNGRIAYRAGGYTIGLTPSNLYIVNTNGTMNRQINGNLVTNESLGEFEFSDDMSVLMYGIRRIGYDLVHFRLF